MSNAADANMSQQSDLEIIAELQRLGEVVDNHPLTCICREYCAPFMVLMSELQRRNLETTKR